MTPEIECRFLEIDKDALVAKLLGLGATDKGEVMLEEVIIYGPNNAWKDEPRFVRIRKMGDRTALTYKEHRNQSLGGAHEIEFGIEDLNKATSFFEAIGFPPFRWQQKKRHTLHLGSVTFDIDTWPTLPPYVELEGESEESLKEAAARVGYEWSNAVFNDAAWVIQNKYNIAVRELRWFTFDRVE
jgi:adenylate cyclase, class 2